MSNIEYAIYGITEPYTNKIVYIGLYVYDWNENKCYPDNEEIIREAIDTMENDNNKYWRDLNNMYCYNIDYEHNNKVLTGVVVLESWYEEDEEVNYLDVRLKYWRDIFKPRYNVKQCGCGCDCIRF